MARRHALPPFPERYRVSRREGRLAGAAALLDHSYGQPALLDQALTHPSAPGPGGAAYQRLEFLGDRVLGLVVADMLLAAFPGDDEGALARRHVGLVRSEALARVALDIDLGRYLVLSRGEEESGGRSNPGLLSDALEAVIASLYLDGGMAPAEAFIRRHWTATMEAAERPPEDSKTRLQEWAQGAGRPLPVYTVLSTTGPAHSPEFEIEVRVEGEAPASALGPSKRAAEQAAAARLLAETVDK